jgi:hypothetical protein
MTDKAESCQPCIFLKKMNAIRRRKSPPEMFHSKRDSKTYPANGFPTCKLYTTYLMKLNCVNNIYSAVNL